MEITSQELEVHSSSEKPSRFENFKTGSSSKHTAYDGSRLVNKTSEDLTNEHDQRFSKKFLKYSEASGSGLNEAAQKLLVNCSRSKICSFSHKGKEIMQANNEVEELNERLKILEEETEAMKQAFIETMEERKKLVNEIYQDFLKIHHRHHFGNQVTGLKIPDRSLIVSSSNEAVMRSGLLQVLCEDSNPCIVTRDHRANMHFRLFS